MEQFPVVLDSSHKLKTYFSAFYKKLESLQNRRWRTAKKVDLEIESFCKKITIMKKITLRISFLCWACYVIEGVFGSISLFCFEFTAWLCSVHYLFLMPFVSKGTLNWEKVQYASQNITFCAFSSV